jgi:hypothetical protein
MKKCLHQVQYILPHKREMLKHVYCIYFSVLQKLATFSVQQNILVQYTVFISVDLLHLNMFTKSNKSYLFTL